DLGVRKVLDKIPYSDKYYVTIDIDCFDISLATGTGSPSPGGLSFNFLNDILVGIAEKGNVICFDLVEVAPQYDPTNATPRLAAMTMINFMVRILKNKIEINFYFDRGDDLIEQFRLENDLIGQKEVPLEAYYGIQTIRAKKFNITGYTINSEIIKAIATVKKAAAIANVKEGHLNNLIGKFIIKAADEIINGKLHDQFIVDPIQGGAGTSVNINANEVIANRALELWGKEKGDYNLIHPNNHVNMSQSTNNVYPTANHISILRHLSRLENTMIALKDTFVKKGQELDDVIK